MASSIHPRQPAGDTAPSVYDRRLVPLGYDLLIGAVFLPFGGVARLRRRALDLLDIQPGTRVLELGCGTGGITRLLAARGADVMAVDGSRRMLKRAQSRTPGAGFVQARLQAFHAGSEFDVALFAFVLHELSTDDRRQALVAAVAALRPSGTLAIVDHAVPATRGLSRAWRQFLLRLEPASVVDCIEGGYLADLAAIGVAVEARHALAGGTAQLLIARRQ